MTRFRVGDLLVILVILLAAGVLFVFSLMPKRAGEVLVVEHQNGKESYSLAKDRTFVVSSGGEILHIVIENKKAYVEKSTCPDKTCMHQGKISAVGETIICVPSGTVLYIEGEIESEDDVLAG